MDMKCTMSGMEMDMNCTMPTMPMMTMVMTFQFTKTSTVLFDGWSFSSVGGLIGSMIGIFALAFGYEGLKFLRVYLLTNAALIRQKNRSSGDDRFTQLTMLSKSHLIQTTFYGIQAIISYFLMLIVMTYNAWLGIAVVLGLVCGFFVFGWKTSQINEVSGDHSA